MSNFIVHGLPRSRTAWLSTFLTYKDHVCDHEVARKLRTVSDIPDYFQPNVGASETGAAQAYQLIRYHVPGIKTVVVKRPVDEVRDSIQNIVDNSIVMDWGKLDSILAYTDRMLQQISQQSDTLTVQFKDLEKMDICAAVFEHCLPYKFDVKWWGNLKNKNIQDNFKQMIKYSIKHRPEIENLKRLLKKELLHLRRSEPDNLLWKRA